MSHIDKFDRKSVHDLAHDFEFVLRDFADKYGLKVKISGGKFNDMSYRPNFEFCVVGDNGRAMDGDVRDFERNCWVFGLDKNDLGRTFWSSNSEYEVVGLKSRSKKFPVLCKRKSDGKIFKFPSSTVIRAFRPHDPAMRKHL